VVQGNGSFTYTCETGTTCSDPTAVGVQCLATADCPTGDVCCLDANNVATCAATCGNGGTQLCDPTAATSGCPQGVPCQAGGADGLPGTQGTCGG
jgi:hypothetical protein